MILRFVNFLMIVVFALSVIVQYNDANAVRWMLIYGATCMVSILFVAKKLHWLAAAAVAVVSGGWALLKIPGLTRAGFLHMLDEVHMTQTGVEAAREFLGLLIICAWVGTLAVSVYRENKRQSGSTQEGQTEMF